MSHAGHHIYYYATPRRSGAVFGASGATRLLGAEADGVALDFTDLSVTVRDTATPANNFAGNVNSWLTYTSPSTKWILNSSGVYVSGTTLRTVNHNVLTMPRHISGSPNASVKLPKPASCIAGSSRSAPSSKT